MQYEIYQEEFFKSKEEEKYQKPARLCLGFIHDTRVEQFNANLIYADN